ncbi:MAG: hypothetical protein MJ252_29335 [archaeon]|nr:hypothetical protein [archaeon]
MLDNRYIRLIVFGTIQLAILIIYGTCSHLPSDDRTECFTNPKTWHCFQTFELSTAVGFDRFELGLLGFGALYTLFKDHSMAALVIVLFGYFVTVEWGYLTMAFFYQSFRRKETLLDQENKQFYDIKIVGGELLSVSAGPVAAVFISYGALIGTINIPQFLVMIFIECILYSLNYYLDMLDKTMAITDIAGITTIHTFGAFFGAGCSFILNRNKSEKKIKPNFISAFVALFVAFEIWFIYQQGINWAGENNTSRVATVRGHTYRIHTVNVYVTTYNYGAIGSVIGMFGTSLFFNRGALKPEEILYSTLTGTLIIGNIAGWMEYPIFGFIFGMVGAILCVLSIRYVKPILTDKFKYYDSLGILYYHGFPALLGSIICAIRIASLSGSGWELKDDSAPDTKIQIAPYLIPQMRGYTEKGETIGKRNTGGQAGFQLLAEILTLIFAVGGGVGAGFLMNLDVWGKVQQESTDEEFFSEVPAVEQGNSNQGNAEAYQNNTENEGKTETEQKENLLS